MPCSSAEKRSRAKRKSSAPAGVYRGRVCRFREIRGVPRGVLHPGGAEQRMRVRSRQPDARAGGREVGEEERAKLPVALHETREGEDDELGGAEVVGEEPRGEFDGEAEERLEKVSHLLDAKAHQELHAKLVKANLAARLVAPQDVPPALRRHHRPSVAESAHHRLGELGRAAHRVDDGVARGGVHHPRGGAVGERALRRHRRGTAERNPTRLLLDDILHLHRESSHD